MPHWQTTRVSRLRRSVVAAEYNIAIYLCMREKSGRDAAIFTQAIRLPVAKRAAFLDEDSAGDEDSRCNVEALLRAHERVGDFLKTPTLASELGPETDDGTTEKKNLGSNSGGFDHE
jgi:hypothetical protein